MRTSNYKLIFALSVEHSYYKNNICASLQFTPSIATAAVLQRYGFKIRTRENGFQLYVNVVSSIRSILEYIENATGQASFRFEIKDTAEEFANVTDWPHNWKGKFVFDNSDASNAIVDETVLLNQTLEQSILTEGSLVLHFKNLFEMLDRGIMAYSIGFRARSTQWQYYIVNRSEVPLTNPFVRGKSGIAFAEPKQVVIPTGEKALCFSSNEMLLPMSQVAGYVFDLVNDNRMQNTNGPKGKVIFKGLPTPDPLIIETVDINGKAEASSPMYVYL
ncbi:MAG: hypothetical protein IPP72_16840 [Chitinophagaceae bacterium]|nr:hypothetical protein [Chitinophagaceae bacterium]